MEKKKILNEWVNKYFFKYSLAIFYFIFLSYKLFYNGFGIKYVWKCNIYFFNYENNNNNSNDNNEKFFNLITTENTINT